MFCPLKRSSYHSFNKYFTFSSLILHTFSLSLFVLSESLNHILHSFCVESEVTIRSHHKQLVSSSWISCIRYGIGFGTLLFLTHVLITCHGVLARNLDLHPFPYGIGSIVAMFIGFLLVDTTFTR